jgi:hypothetical protein
MRGYSWVWVLWLLSFATLIWTAFRRRPFHHYYSGRWGYGGARYGGPDFGIPTGWPAGLRSDQRVEQDRRR